MRPIGPARIIPAIGVYLQGKTSLRGYAQHEDVH